MRSVHEAIQHLIQPLHPLPVESISIVEAYGRILASDIAAKHSLPPFANSSMDGFAVIHDDLADLPTTLTVIEDIPAGHAPQKTVQRGEAARIMTGAPLPAGADTVIRVEDTDADERSPMPPPTVTINVGAAKGSNIRAVGEDVSNGEIVLKAGRRLRAADIGILAGLGYSAVSVRRRPKIAVLSTGDELLTPDEALAPGKIRDMNSYAIPALITALGGEAISLGIARDNEADVRAKFQQAIDTQADLIISSAGVSVGAFDVVKTVLASLGNLEFWKVNMRPGKPLTVGQLSGIPFLGLPGNPVSAMVTFMVFARPMMAVMLGQNPDMHTTRVRIGETINSDGRMTFARVQVRYEDGQAVAYTTGTQSSGAISSLVKADALLIIPADVKTLAAGDMADSWPLDL